MIYKHRTRNFSLWSWFVLFVNISPLNSTIHWSHTILIIIAQLRKKHAYLCEEPVYTKIELNNSMQHSNVLSTIPKRRLFFSFNDIKIGMGIVIRTAFNCIDPIDHKVLTRGYNSLDMVFSASLASIMHSLPTIGIWMTHYCPINKHDVTCKQYLISNLFYKSYFCYEHYITAYEMQASTNKHFTWIGLKCLHVEDVFYYHSVCCDYNCLHQRITLKIAPPHTTVNLSLSRSTAVTITNVTFLYTKYFCNTS